MECFEKAISLSPEGDPRKGGFISNLGLAYFERFQRQGELVDVDMSVSYQNEAALLMPDGERRRPGLLDALGIAHYSRFQTLGEIQDINSAIERYSQAVLLTPNGHEYKPIRLNHLGLAYETRFVKLGRLDDIENAILHQTTAASLTPDTHTQKPEILDSLGGAYHTRFERFKKREDLDLALVYIARAVELTPIGHANMHSRLNMLGSVHHRLYLDSERPEDLELAISCITRATLLTPDGCPAQGGQFFNLARLHSLRSRLLGHSTDVDRAIFYCQQAIRVSGTSDPLTKFDAARVWVIVSMLNHRSLELEAYKYLMDAVPQVVWLGANTECRFERVKNLGDQVAGAVTIAIAHRAFDLALEWMEQGRSIVWNQLVQLRTPFVELAAVDPPLAETLKHLAQSFDQGLLHATGNIETESSQEVASQLRRRLAERWEKSIEQARRIPRFDNFLRPMKKFQLLAAARSTTG
ncbi:hypothetical protein FRC07_000954 [Ceratobasidium sp. 392]|nr:hypothetical protein FRC07_000954 [Ceratobasidium sp. 392]